MMKQLALRLKSLEDEDPWIIEQKTFEIMDDYLQPDSATSAARAASAIDDLIPTKRELVDGEKVESAESFLLETWGTFIEIAKQIPDSHPSQLRLAQLIKALTQLPPAAVTVWKTEKKIWKDLPLMDVAFREAWIEPSNAEDTLEPFQQWVNLNAFSARLLDLGLAEWVFFAVWSIRAALEQETAVRDLWTYRILAGVQWIEHSGLNLFKRLSDVELTEDEKRNLQGGPLYHGPSGLCPERWAFWRSRFRDIAEGTGSEEVRKSAGKAADLMEAFENED
ncbi:hypothetical protein BDZ45DRAFT_633469 [Acephala macrosclerotiorum]|nr:hypothetical protein BDZ45DRAFT_633469 [Acephala macrosclerotiorum]